MNDSSMEKQGWKTLNQLMKCLSYSGSRPACDLVICGWRGKTSLRAFINHGLRFHYLRLFSEKLAEERKDNTSFEFFFTELSFLDSVIEKIDKDLSFLYSGIIEIKVFIEWNYLILLEFLGFNWHLLHHN